ncbi:putative membrane-bound dehydrogenase domain-containing protein [Dyadobacter soli]|uniref:Putative membrane-bound dehydrogenase domain-containing protein n=1 Tax=Dyadobacter soli TaxID=659014 RepID=A0A1G7ZYC6_9BACT|nr:PVC-type heme-binding CxxCH protein [Dyadobacter soli]SDH13662.1 putative membrane-bound dehydrogenase domain-containing protein [Dyadobacter soli]
MPPFRSTFRIGLPLLAASVLFNAQSCKPPQNKSGQNVTVANAPQQAVTDIYAEHIRTSGFKTPEEERLSFIVPEGFEVTLFASEPDITKPMNMEFDDRGRLWVTQSGEYPVAAGESDGKDRITILEDKNGDGRADTFTHFDDNLNIPIGIMPVADGAIGYSIPNLYHFKDTNDDGKSDSREVLLGGFGHKDTHGMVNNLMRGYDGWLHVCHGFSNVSNVAGTDGDSIRMTSGNTFRVKLDGSHVEQTTFGRVNPFGYAYDEKGFLYSVDCHTKPITQLIFGGDYPHFGKKAPVGLGFAPAMMTYDLGSTALAGLVYYTGTQFPAKYRGSFLTGDVVTCRIDRNTVTFNGSTPSSKKEEPLLVSKDPWFRPVDIKVGPDGALYIADFYNRIIGHYEVALNHPGRDRVSGRIWKVTYKGAEPNDNLPVTDWSKATIAQLLEGLKHPQLNTRLKVADRLVDTWKEKAVMPVKRLLANNGDAVSQVHALWILHRLGALDDGALDNALTDNEQVVKIHALRILSERNALSDGHYRLVTNALKNDDPFIRRAAAEVLTRFPRAENLALLMDLYEKTSVEDTHLRYTAMLGVRSNLKNTSVMWRIPALHWTDAQLALLNKALLDVPSSAGAAFVLDYTLTHELDSKDLLNNLEYIGRLSAPYQVEKAIDLINTKFGNEPEKQLSLYRTIQAGIRQSGAAPSPKMVAWGEQLAGKFLNNISAGSETWKIRKVAKNADPVNSWTVSEHFLVDVVPAFRIVLSEKGGYGPQSALYSVPFKLPATLNMNVFDNDVHNRAEKTGISKNSVKIRLVDGGKVVAEYRVNQVLPMQFKDLIRNATFNLAGYEGKMGYIEAVDSSQAGSVGIGQFKPAVVTIPEKGPSTVSEQRITAAEIAGEYHIKSLQPALRSILQTQWMDYTVRSAAAGALMNIDPKANVDVLSGVFNDPAELPALREKLTVAMGQAASPSVYETLKKQLASGARNLQIVIATVLANTSEGIGYLLNAFKDEELGADIATEGAVQERLTSNADASQQTQMRQLLATGANERAERQKLIDARIANFKPATAFSDAGKVIFVQNCSGCHQIQGSGGLVGPQLDGIGNWGHKALTQKILDPNRNITEAFRTYNITLKNEKTLTGLYRRTEGETIVFADMTGQEFSVAKSDMKEYRASKYTLMPDQFRNIIPEKDFYALLDYLLGVK